MIKVIRNNRFVIIILFLTMVLLSFYLEGAPVSSLLNTTKERDNLKFVTISYEELQKYYPHFDPIFDNTEENKNISVSTTAKSSEYIARQLANKCLEKFRTLENESEKIKSYQIDNIKIIKEFESGAVFSVTYSVIPHRENPRTRWSLSSLEKEIGKKFYASYVKENGQFTLNIIGPNAIAYYNPTDQPDDKVIAANLFAELYLESHLMNQQPDGSRLLQYRIDSVTPSLNKKYFIIIYSVQGIEGKTNWNAGSGEIAEEGWINRKSMLIGLRKYGNFYEVYIAGP